MALNAEQRAWLQQHLGVTRNPVKKAKNLKRTAEYSSFFDKKEKLETLIQQLGEYDFAAGRIKRLNGQIEAAESSLKRQAEDDLAKALKDGNSELDELKSQTSTDVKNAGKFATRFAAVQANVKQATRTSPSDAEKIKLEYAGILVAARKRATNGDYLQAYEDLADAEKSSTVLLKTATKEAAPSKEWEASKKEFDEFAKQLASFSFAENRAQKRRNELGALELHRGQQSGPDAEKAHVKSLKDLSSLKSEIKADIKNAGQLHTRIEAVQFNGRTMMASPFRSKHEKELLSISGALRAARKTAQNGDFTQAYKDLAAFEKSSAVGAKAAGSEIAEKKKWEARKADADTCIEILKVMPEAGPKKIEDSLVTAQALADAGNFKAAHDSLKDYKKLYDAESKAAQGKQQAINDNLAKTDLVNDRLEAIELLLIQLAPLPGLTGWIAEKEVALKKIRSDHTDNSEYAAAWKELEGNWKLAKLESEAKKVSADKSKKALNNETIKKLNANVQKDLAALKDLATDDALAAYRNSLARGMDIYINATNVSKPKTEDLDKAEREAMAIITKLNGDIDKDLGVLGKAKKDCEDLRTSVENGLKMLAAVVTTEARSRLGLEWERLSAALAIKEFEKSKPKLEQLKKDINNLLEQNTRETQAWEAELGKLEKVIPKQLEKITNCPVTSSNAASVRDGWNELKQLGSRREPGEALAGVQGLTGLIDEQLELVKQYDALGTARKAANLKVGSELKSAAGEIEKLKAAVAKARASDSPDGHAEIEFEADHKRLTTQWEGDMKAAYKNAGELEKKTADMIAAIAEMIKAIEAAASDSKAIQTIASTQESDEKRLVYLKKADEVRDKLEELADMDSRSSVKFEKELSKIDKGSTGDYDKAIGETNDLLVEVVKAIIHAKDVHKNTLDSVKLTAEATRKKVAETKKKLGKKGDGFKDFFANLLTLIDDMEKSLMASSSFAVLMTANHEFNEILRPMYEIVADAEKGGKDKLDYSSVMKTAEAQSKYLNSDANLDKCQPTMKNLLLEKFTGIQTAIKAQSPREATATLAAFQKELDEIKVKADSANAKRTTFALNAKTAKAKLKRLDQKLDYSRSLAAKLKGLEAAVLAENKEDTAARDLVLLLVEIDRALNDPEFAIGQELEVRKAEQIAEQQRKEWEANLKAFDSVMAEVNKAMKNAGDDADLSQVRELEAMKKECKSVAKGGDYVTALKKLDLTRQHATKVIKNPVGERVSSRNNLPKDLSRYQAAVRGFNKHMTELFGLIKKEGEKLDKNALDTAQKMLKSMQFEFDIKVFDKAVGLLSNKKADTNAKRAAREQVLSTVRSYQTRLDKGPVMLKVLLAPFKPDARPAFDSVRIALNSLDVNVRRCV